MAEERSFDVVDRRRVKAEAAAASENVEDQETAETAEAAPDQAAGEPIAAAAGEAGASDPSEEDFDLEEEGAEDEGSPFAGGGFPMPEVTVEGILRMCFGLLSERAWVDLGLHADPMTGKVEQNLSQARRAIDACGDLMKHLDPDLAPEERREIQFMLSNLRVNFVQRSRG